MIINQNNKNGDNIVNVHQGITARILTEEIKHQVLLQLKKYNATGVAIHFEYSSETEQFVEQIRRFLQEKRFNVSCISKMMSGTPKGAFSIEPPKDNLGWAYIRIGSL